MLEGMAEKGTAAAVAGMGRGAPTTPTLPIPAPPAPAAADTEYIDGEDNDEEGKAADCDGSGRNLMKQEGLTTTPGANEESAKSRAISAFIVFRLFRNDVGPRIPGGELTVLVH
jgi:hypothetical protein